MAKQWVVSFAFTHIRIKGQNMFQQEQPCISPRHLVTAQHVVKPTRNLDGNAFNLTSILIDFSPEASTNHFSPNNPWLKLLRPVVKESVGMDECAQMGGAECWKSVNDFAFLSFEDCNYKHDYFLLPTSIKVIQQLSSMLVVGFPNKIEKKAFQEEYTRDKQEQNKKDEFYERMRELMSGFERKTLSFGSGMVKDMVKNKLKS
ncbi:predicted protein [Naegleria gruberi]|uniref:Predicted protein n=1 Tax=Naegleria gruberi TaxID=5762 RepID=D2VEX2_NAEGR|nr:uncharacterized protein NAEGRDRAFT_48980 [Naegleria gruberi]EFC44582.1 predicted protein [Naegleria gruberi]|eukprot:XP_002677326.1 predicted protein [Naegleria gruberi strain NEG-M]